MSLKLLTNGRFYTPQFNSAPPTAMLVSGDSIFALGSGDELKAAAPVDTEVFDLGGRTVWPGLTDAHLHLKMYAEFLTQVDCETPTLEECLRRVSARVASTPAGEWILGHGWNQNVWPGGYGNARHLDGVSEAHAIYLTDKALHSGWANSLALRLAGVDRNTPDPPGGKIQRDDQGNPTGLFFENAVRLIEKVIPPIEGMQLQAALLAAQQALLYFGVTSVHDFDGRDCFSALEALHAEQKLKLRVCKGIRREDLEAALNLGVQTGFGDDQLWIGAVKCFADGALGPQSAAMLMPYEGTQESGTLLMTADDVFEVGMQAVPHGLSLAIHAIGDAATHEVLNGFGMLREFEMRRHLPALNHRIEHLQLLHPDDLLKPRQLGITASMQPQHATSDMLMADRYWGARARYAYLYNSMIKTGARVIFGSDAPVESPNPFLGLHAAVTRRRVDGSPSSEGWYPSERVPLYQALKAYTTSPAEVSGKTGKLGILSSGAKADLILLDQDPFSIAPSDLANLQPSGVMAGGNWIFGQN